MSYEPTANQNAALSDDDADWLSLSMTSPLPWNSTDKNISSVSSMLAATYACYRTMGFIIYTLVAGTLCILGLAGNSVAYIVLGNSELVMFGRLKRMLKIKKLTDFHLGFFHN